MTGGATLSGGCLCGQIRYRIDGPLRLVTHCHCSRCRRACGSAFVTWLTVRAEYFSLTQGEPIRRPSTDHGWRGFCPTCGSPLTSGSSHYPKYVEVTAGTLDDPGAVEPERHVYWPDRLPWVRFDDGLPRHIEGANSPPVP